MAERPATAICFGEVLWDFLPDGLHAGGAPFNVAYHLHAQGVRVLGASAVGDDTLGEELLRRLDDWDISTAHIARTARRTGFVRALIGSSGDARYEIARKVAWDQIAIKAPLLREARNARAVIFGSLAQRTRENRTALATLLDALPDNALRVFDVNFRPPHDDLKLAAKLAARANVLKLNHEEAARLAGGSEKPGHEERNARELFRRFGCERIVVTAGAHGAGLLRDGRWLWEKGRRVQVLDTIGAGDSFLATLVAHLLRGSDDRTALRESCRTGEWVATQRGATPAYKRTTSRH